MITRNNLNTQTGSSQEATNQPVQPTELERSSAEKPVPIEVRLGIPAWMMRDPGPRIEIEDDDVDFEEGT